jgi:hypothetical protein
MGKSLESVIKKESVLPFKYCVFLIVEGGVPVLNGGPKGKSDVIRTDKGRWYSNFTTPGQAASQNDPVALTVDEKGINIFLLDKWSTTYVVKNALTILYADLWYVRCSKFLIWYSYKIKFQIQGKAYKMTLVGARKENREALAQLRADMKERFK